MRAEAVRRQRQHPPVLVAEPLCDGASLAIAVLAGAPVQRSDETAADRGEACAGRDRHEVLPADPLAARLDAALVVARARAREAWLEDVVRCERLEAGGELALGADEDLGDRGTEMS